MSDLPQLRMRHRLGALPPIQSIPRDSVLRIARTDDVPGLCRVLSEAFGKSWDCAQVHEEILANTDVLAVFVIEKLNEIVATASYQIKKFPDPEAAWVHWVAVLPSAQGQALGEIVTRRVIEEAVVRDRTTVLLTTDDVRLAAIRTYLRLGFEPDPCHESHTLRWHEVFTTLNR